jgi:hypothetical protein
MVHAMDQLGYDVVTLGEREFNFGQKFLLDAFKQTKIDLVSANIVYAASKKPFVKPYVIRKEGPLRVAVTGVLGKTIKFKTSPADQELEVLDPTETLQKLIPELRKKADIVVVLSHQGLPEGSRLITDVPGMDVMIFGHMAGLYRSIVKTQDVINARGGERGQYIPQIHLVVEDGKITAFDGDVVALDDKVPPDEAMGKEVDQFSDMLNQRFAKANESNAAAQAQATAAQISGDHYLGEAACRRCHEEEYKMYQSQAHARAFETLVKNQRESTPECLPCHVVGYGQPGGFVSKQATPSLVNVQCENCHGMGTKHPQPGQVVGPDVCITCHSSTQDPRFQYDEAVAKIVHWK